MKSSLRNRLSELKIIIIGEISMIFNNLFFYDHLRLNEIFGTVMINHLQVYQLLLLVIFFNFHKLGGRPVYADYQNDWQNFESLWKLFKMFELTEVMQQRGDGEFIDLLNNVCTGDTQPCDIRLLESRLLNHNHPTTHKMPFIFLLKMQVQKDIN